MAKVLWRHPDEHRDKFSYPTDRTPDDGGISVLMCSEYENDTMGEAMRDLIELTYCQKCAVSLIKTLRRIDQKLKTKSNHDSVDKK
jgi:hypothetical protein